MVGRLTDSLPAATARGIPLLWAAQETGETLLMRLDPHDRAKVVMALLGLVLVGVGLMALTLFAGRQVVRMARKSHGPTRAREHDWYRKPLVPKEPDSPTARDPE